MLAQLEYTHQGCQVISDRKKAILFGHDIYWQGILMFTYTYIYLKYYVKGTITIFKNIRMPVWYSVEHIYVYVYIYIYIYIYSKTSFI